MHLSLVIIIQTNRTKLHDSVTCLRTPLAITPYKPLIFKDALQSREKDK
ncbi:uncharacterized protein An12g10940 [Aspergillus niger]|uniref:Contig An12c0380, genomic contig n=2 Tax=Aspergillus niger TaxID=5061 RepID=A2R151_ASPNC|nr:uncharacterized protein An12g10940 [Aspergillus niger]CAK41441.1 unnamed protein product [Aspergillus niger]